MMKCAQCDAVARHDSHFCAICWDKMQLEREHRRDGMTLGEVLVVVGLLCVWMVCIFASAAAHSQDLDGLLLKIRRACDTRTLTWTQPDPQPKYWEVEFRRMYAVGTAITYELPRTFKVDVPMWSGKVAAGLYQGRVRACDPSWSPVCTAWSATTDAALAAGGKPHLLSLFVCPPSGFEPR